MVKPISDSLQLAAEILDHPNTPERNLIAACLERAIRDILNKPMPQKKSENIGDMYCREACVWLRSQSTKRFSFKWVCEHLDLCPIQIRRRVYEMQKNGERFRYEIFGY